MWCRWRGWSLLCWEGVSFISFMDREGNVIEIRTCIWDRGGCPMLWIIIPRIRFLNLFDFERAAVNERRNLRKGP